MDIKLDFVPPSLINFISRQLISNGFRLYKKTVASMMSHGEEELSKALGDPLYVRIRESLSLNKMRIFSLLKRTLLKVSKMRQRLQLKRIKAINMQIVPRRWW
ncbi:hypothetical protein Ahy_B10g102814 isoform E [Arachis hypogaea]|uniref:Uncharacterized protein n=1 Tax=Arachis hypogaea TaxID=3818 RepID=A0A444X2M6_ARAHY|nr:hypothetical protein Ahy_B10g102814 isoform E [Arachis hypogaea]